MDADRLPTRRADGDREALRILLSARQEMTTASTAQTNRLRALLLSGDDADRQLARGALTEARLAGLVRRRRAGPAASSPCGTLRSAAWRSSCATQPAS